MLQPSNSPSYLLNEADQAAKAQSDPLRHPLLFPVDRVPLLDCWTHRCRQIPQARHRQLDTHADHAAYWLQQQRYQCYSNWQMYPRQVPRVSGRRFDWRRGSRQHCSGNYGCGCPFPSLHGILKMRFLRWWMYNMGGVMSNGATKVP
jgi:hypothetical protein